MKNSFTCLVKSKQVKLEVIHTVIFPPMISALFPNTFIAIYFNNITTIVSIHCL